MSCEIAEVVGKLDPGRVEWFLSFCSSLNPLETVEQLRTTSEGTHLDPIYLDTPIRPDTSEDTHMHTADTDLAQPGFSTPEETYPSEEEILPHLEENIGFSQMKMMLKCG